MATAKLWWNGSSWVTSSTYWVNESKQGNHQLAAGHNLMIVAYDDFTIKMAQGVSGYQTASIYNNVYWDGSITVTSGSATIASNVFSNRDVTAYSSFSYSGTIYVYGNAGGTVYSADGQSFSGSTTITDPFYSVTYNANGGTGAPSATKGVKGFAGTLSSTIPIRTNHTFLGWATSSSSHTAAYSAGGTIPARSSNITLYAVWRPTVFISAGEGVTITFNGTNYTNTTATIKNLTWGSSYTLTIKANAGWIIKTRSHADGSITLNADETTISATGQRVGCHIDDGAQYVQAVMYLDTGTEWQMVQAYYDDGTDWNLVY